MSVPRLPFIAYSSVQCPFLVISEEGAAPGVSAARKAQVPSTASGTTDGDVIGLGGSRNDVICGLYMCICIVYVNVYVLYTCVLSICSACSVTTGVIGTNGRLVTLEAPSHVASPCFTASHSYLLAPRP